MEDTVSLASNKINSFSFYPQDTNLERCSERSCAVPKNGAGRSTGSINFVISAIHITNFRRLSLAPSRLCLCAPGVLLAVFWYFNGLALADCELGKTHSHRAVGKRRNRSGAVLLWICQLSPFYLWWCGAAERIGAWKYKNTTDPPKESNINAQCHARLICTKIITFAIAHFCKKAIKN